jgi:hypothetical protein
VPRRRVRLLGAVAATLAAVLVVTSFAVLLSERTGYSLFGPNVPATNAAGTRFANSTYTSENATATALSATSTAAAQASATAYARSPFPYTAAAPGPQCDPGLARWTYAGTASLGPSQVVQCHTDHTTLQVIPNSNYLGSYGNSYLIWSLAQQGVSIPSTLTFSVTVTNRNADMWSNLIVITRAESYYVQLLSPGSHVGNGYLANRCVYPSTTTCYGLGGNSSYPTSGPHTLAISFNGAHVTLEVDTNVAGTYTEPAAASIQAVQIEVANTGTTQSCAADIANFQIKIL